MKCSHPDYEGRSFLCVQQFITEASVTVALNGGFVNTTIGKNTDNTPEYVLSEEDAKVYDTALKQLDERFKKIGYKIAISRGDIKKGR